MEKKKPVTAIIVILCISLAAIILLITIGYAADCHEENPEKWILQSYGNNVALYNGDEIIEVYGSISLDTLPEADKNLLKNGIAFQTKSEALTAIEDFDG